ncbi:MULTISPECIES: phage holin family protein [Actinomycetaceae]|uniref:phage holin family protein n=1 Tax=Actinomycetaceae TaxID=2049 RepID=UPI000931D6BA|nr:MULTISPECIES: phage holin family protein [Actinomycetaceae]MBS5826794.1 phage holin family protein [Actinomyces sp.]MDU5231154.1 phage holin family protein [Actinomyces sp.]MDU6756656.1 phage holin family protein [Actinomyces sp.]WIK62660.1 phage holin family protein [Gleimia europaea]
MSFLLLLLANMVGIWFASLIIPGITLPSSEGAVQAILILAVIALVFTALNLVVRPLLKVLTFPIYILTFGLFSLVVNALIFMLTGWVTTQIGYGMEVTGFWAALFGAVVTAIFSSIAGAILGATVGSKK